MRRRARCRHRRGAFALEGAVVYPVMITLLLGLVIGGTGVFRYQQVACQAREAARWASVRGGNYQTATGSPSPTQSQIAAQAVNPMAAGMNLQYLTVQVQWVDQSSATAYAWDGASKAVMSITSKGEYVTDTVRVTVTYQWAPNFLGVGPLNLVSTSEIPMAN
jgi:Flp pilus assembly protein TadG